MKRAPTALLIALAALTLSLAAQTQAATTGFGLGFQGGYGQSKDAESGSPIAGVHAILNVTSWLGLAGMFDYKFPEDYKQGDADYTVKSFPISAMGRIYIPVMSFSPYIAAGFQYRLINYGGDLFKDTSLDDSDTSFGWLAGAGAEFNLGQKTEFFGELRYESSDPDQDWQNAVDDAKGLSYDQWTARVGFTFFLK
jgi:opacity protein-like surface antigen